MAVGLDNPFHAALTSLHAGLAVGSGEVVRFPRDVAPFLGVADASVAVGDALATLVPPGDEVLLLGVAPSRLPAGWALEPFPDLAQLVCDAPLALPEGPPIIALDPRHRDDVLALVALVYPHYFRPDTMRLGRYFGIYLDGRLAAMVGERLGTATHRELSAICTHPDYVGRGLARRLTAWLANRQLHEGVTPFLHVAYANVRAKALYERMGFRLRRDLPFWSLRQR